MLDLVISMGCEVGDRTILNRKALGLLLNELERVKKVAVKAYERDEIQPGFFQLDIANLSKESFESTLKELAQLQVSGKTAEELKLYTRLSSFSLTERSCS